MGGRCAAGQQTKKVTALDRREPGVPIVCDLRTVEDRDGQGFEVVVQCLGQAKGVPILGHVTLCDLRQPMHARIRPARRRNGVRARFKPRQRILDCALHRGLIGLSLPADEGRAVIFDFQCKPRHEKPLAWPAAGNNPPTLPSGTWRACGLS